MKQLTTEALGSNEPFSLLSGWNVVSDSIREVGLH